VPCLVRWPAKIPAGTDANGYRATKTFSSPWPLRLGCLTLRRIC
jgi:hypothetical protein